MFQPRPYQADAVRTSLDFFRAKKNYNGLLILPTGSGKSVVVALIAMGLEGKTIIFQPSKEILQQNYSKFIQAGGRAAIYSASAGQKWLDRVVFATIGSVAKKHHLFREYNNIIIDECHLVNANGGMYLDFINAVDDSKVLGLTATPYRLTSTMEGAMLKFLTRTRPKVFNKVLYYVQNKVLFDAGYLAKLEYYKFNVIDRSMLRTNSTGTDFTEQSLRSYYRKINMPQITIGYANRLLAKRNNLLVFCSLIEEARAVVAAIPGAEMLTGDTKPKERDDILSRFKAGKLRCVVNVGVLTTGFDYPGLEVVLIARSTMSLALYYQIIGRVMRPYKYPDGTEKVAWVVDLGNNFGYFGKIETMEITETSTGLHTIVNNGRQLTNVIFQK